MLLWLVTVWWLAAWKNTPVDREEGLTSFGLPSLLIEKKWDAIRKPLDTAYLQALLPKPFRGLEYIQTETTPHLWSDGRLIFRMLCYKSVKHETIFFKCLVRQPLQGPPTLLTWQVYYENNDPENRDAQKALDRFWYPVGNGKIASVYGGGLRRNELFFDIDPANHALHFIQGGQVWTLALK